MVGLLQLTTAVTLLASTVFAREDQHSAAVAARTLISRENLLTLITVYQEGAFSGHPTGQMEYYADCDGDGSVTMVGMRISTAFRNAAAGSDVSVAIRVGDHGPLDSVDRRYPGGNADSAIASPRITMMGKLEELIFDDHHDEERVRQCFLGKHPDAKWWIPGVESPVHDAFWAKFTPNNIHFIGGFGDRAYIGPLNMTEFKAAEPQLSFIHQ